MIVAGFPGVGKTSWTKKIQEGSTALRVHDSDSSTFDKKEFPNNYVKAIEERLRSYSFVLVSTHDTVQRALLFAGHRFVLVYPTLECKGEYMLRYQERGSPAPFLELMESKWESFVQGCHLQSSPCVAHVVLRKGEFMQDAAERIAKAHHAMYSDSEYDEL